MVARPLAPFHVDWQFSGDPVTGTRQSGPEAEAEHGKSQKNRTHSLNQQLFIDLRLDVVKLRQNLWDTETMAVQFMFI